MNYITIDWDKTTPEEQIEILVNAVNNLNTFVANTLTERAEKDGIYTR